MNDGKRHYGDGLYKQAAELIGLKEQTLMDFSWMVGVFEFSFRKENCSFAHHKEVASLKLIATARRCEASRLASDRSEFGSVVVGDDRSTATPVGVIPIPGWQNRENRFD